VMHGQQNISSSGFIERRSEQSEAGRVGGREDLSHDSESHSLSSVLTYHPVVSPDQELARQIWPILDTSRE
jgi:hypothetical protein